jgi:four helix bundle protein
LRGFKQAVFNFEKLEVWHKAVIYAGNVYRLSRAFPKDEQFGLTNQMRRAGISISANIAEGSARPHADFARFIGYATGSVFEVVTQAKIAKNEGFLRHEDYELLYAEAEEISRMLSGLRRSLGE